MGEAIHPGKEVSINAQDSIGEKIENLTSMMYKTSIQQQKGKKPFRPRVYPQRGRGQRRQNFDNRDRSRNNDSKDKILDNPRIDVEIITAEVTIGKILVEITSGIEVDKSLGETIVMTEGDQEKEVLHPESMVIGDTVAQTQVQGPDIDLIQEKQQIEIELDVLDAESMITLPMNVQTLVQMTLMVMDQIVQHCN